MTKYALQKTLKALQKKHPVTFAILIITFAAVAWWQGWIAPTDPTTYLHNEPGSYRVARFVDGDTIVVDMNGTDETIRFIGMDTPETHKPNAPVQCYGVAASAYTKNRIGSQQVRLVSDDLTTNRDRYNRLLRYVMLEDGTNLNMELVQKGYAFAYSFPNSHKAEFYAEQDKAQAAKVGLWGNCKPYQSSTGQWHTEDLTD